MSPLQSQAFSRTVLKTIALLLVVFAMMLLPVLVSISTASAQWQGTFHPFVHEQWFCGTIDADGQVDAGVEYVSSQRRVLVGGAYLQWSSGHIGCLQAAYAKNPSEWGAVVFHAFNKNSNTCNALSYYGWSATNLPGPSTESFDNGCELRIYIQNPGSLSSSSQYYAQTRFNDTAYPGTSTQGEVTEDTYLVQINPWPLPKAPLFRDYNGKVCIGTSSAYNVGGGGSC